MYTKIQWQTIVRTILTAVGSFLIGTTIFHHVVLAPFWSDFTGIVLTVFSTIWGIADKTAGVEQIQSALRQVVVFIGGIFVARGYITGDNLTAILALIPVLLPIAQSHAERSKSNQLAAGKITTQQLKK